MRFQTLGDKAEFLTSRVRNDSSSSIPLGTPVALSLDTTEDGLAVVLPADSSAGKLAAFFYGVSLDVIAANDLGEVQIWGFCRNNVLLRGTRSATTASWSSIEAIASALWLTFDTVNNAFSTIANTIGVSATDAANLTWPQIFAVLAASVASIAASASATTDSRTALTNNAKTFLRGL